MTLVEQNGGEKVEKLVSIIVPVFNVEDYLTECIESAIKQTYHNLEIIIVDDGSTDTSGKICDMYAHKDDRVKAFHKQNGGLSDARNTGIEEATGEYIYFLDSDDILPTCAIEKTLNACVKENADIAIAGLERFVDDKLPQSNEKVEGQSGKILDKTETIRRMLLHDGFGHEACGKLYKKDIWKYERFPKGRLYEDYATIYKIICGCNKVVVLTENLYWYRTRLGSIMKSKLTSKNMQLLDIAQEVTNYLKCEVPEVENEARYLQMVTYLKLMKGILDNGFSTFPKEQNRIRNYVLSCKPLLKMNFAKKKDIIKAKSFLLNKRLFYIIYTLGEKTHL